MNKFDILTGKVVTDKINEKVANHLLDWFYGGEVESFEAVKDEFGVVLLDIKGLDKDAVFLYATQLNKDEFSNELTVSHTMLYYFPNFGSEEYSHSIEKQWETTHEDRYSKYKDPVKKLYNESSVSMLLDGLSYRL